MSVVGAIIRKPVYFLLTICICVTFSINTQAEGQQQSRVSKSKQPIIDGWEPIKTAKPTVNGWEAVAKSAVVLRKLNKLTDEDYSAALQAVRHALSEIPDGKVYRWKRTDTRLSGKVMPTSVFRDQEGRVCRHLIYTLSLDKYIKTVEGIACRSLNGNWNLSG